MTNYQKEMIKKFNIPLKDWDMIWSDYHLNGRGKYISFEAYYEDLFINQEEGDLK